MSLTWELSSELSDYGADAEPLNYLATERLTSARNGLYRAQETNTQQRVYYQNCEEATTKLCQYF